MEAIKKHRTKEEMTSLIASWKSSGLTKQAFCKQHNLAYNIFHYWIRRITSEKDSGDSGFIEIKSQKEFSRIEIVFPSGCIIRLSSEVNPGFIRQLVF